MCDYQRVTSVQIFAGLKDLGRNPFVYALVVVVLVTTVAFYAFARRLVARAGGHRVGAGKGVRGAPPASAAPAAPARSPPRPSRPWSASPRFPTSAWCCSRSRATGTARSCRPGLTLDHVRTALAHDVVVPSIGNSLRYVTLATAFDLVVGTTIAYLVDTRALARRARFSTRPRCCRWRCRAW